MVICRDPQQISLRKKQALMKAVYRGSSVVGFGGIRGKKAASERHPGEHRSAAAASRPSGCCPVSA